MWDSGLSADPSCLLGNCCCCRQTVRTGRASRIYPAAEDGFNLNTYIHASPIIWDAVTGLPDGGRVIRDNVTEVNPDNHQRVRNEKEVGAVVDLLSDAFHAVAVPSQDLSPPDDSAG